MTLSERVANLAGPDRAVDALVHLALHGDMPWIIGHKEGRFPQEPIYGTLADFADWPEDRLGVVADHINAPAYTASLDTAMSVVPEGWAVERAGWHALPGIEPAAYFSLWQYECDKSGKWFHGSEHSRAEAEAATPALALLSAALKAGGL